MEEGRLRSGGGVCLCVDVGGGWLRGNIQLGTCEVVQRFISQLRQGRVGQRISKRLLGMTRQHMFTFSPESFCVSLQLSFD